MMNRAALCLFLVCSSSLDSSYDDDDDGDDDDGGDGDDGDDGEDDDDDDDGGGGGGDVSCVIIHSSDNKDHKSIMTDLVLGNLHTSCYSHGQKVLHPFAFKPSLNTRSN